jgi:hypothetical protein
MLVGVTRVRVESSLSIYAHLGTAELLSSVEKIDLATSSD